MPGSFASEEGTQLDAANVRRAFRKIATSAGLPAQDWTPRELRHSFVSLLSDGGVPLEQISRLVGHSGTSVTELVYRKQIRPVVDDGATVMDRILPREHNQRSATTHGGVECVNGNSIRMRNVSRTMGDGW